MIRILSKLFHPFKTGNFTVFDNIDKKMNYFNSCVSLFIKNQYCTMYLLSIVKEPLSKIMTKICAKGFDKETYLERLIQPLNDMQEPIMNSREIFMVDLLISNLSSTEIVKSKIMFLISTFLSKLSAKVLNTN